MTLSVSIPESLFKKAAEIAAKRNMSVERLALSALAEQVAGWERVEQMAARGNRQDFLEAMGRVPDGEPEPSDRY